MTNPTQKKISSTSVLSRLHSFLRERQTLTTILGAALLIAVGTIVFYYRYPYAFDYSNFYAEDGQDFMRNLLINGPAAILSPFNGYLITGQYIVGVAAQGINELFGSGFATLAKAVSVASYVFWAVVCSLPWLLFRRRLGNVLATMVVIALWVTPLGSYDGAAIGTIGNLKFAFLFIAALLVIYRNDPQLCKSRWQYLVVDIGLLLCATTNIVSIALIPLALVRYRKEIAGALRGKWVRVKNMENRSALLSLILLLAALFFYVLVVKAQGIPAMPGYLDGPLHTDGLLSLLYRATTYAFLFPISWTLPYSPVAVVGIALLSVAILALIFYGLRRQKMIAVVVLAALVVNIVGFVANRPGVTEFFLVSHDSAWPGHFFYAGTMILVVAAGFAGAKHFGKLRIRTKMLACLLVFAGAMVALPAAGLTRQDPYQSVNFPSLESETAAVCSAIPSERDVSLVVFPNASWSIDVPRTIACE